MRSSIHTEYSFCKTGCFIYFIYFIILSPSFSLSEALKKKKKKM